MSRTLFAIFAGALALPAHATELQFEISGIESAAGHVVVALFTEADFLRRPLRSIRLQPGIGKVSGTLGEVPEGAYALSAFHDLNDNGKLDRNFIGIPTEPSGFSNNPTLYGPPTFEKTRIEIRGASQVIAVRLR